MRLTNPKKLIAILTRVNSESIRCCRFSSVEVSGCDYLPDRCCGKSALSFLGSSFCGDLQVLAFLATAAAKKKLALGCRKFAVTLFWNLKQNDTS